jgi:hypothetical protein
MTNLRSGSKPRIRSRIAMLLAYPSAALIVLMVYADHYGRVAGERIRAAFAQRSSPARKRRA